MCLLGIDFGRFASFPVLVLANREELYARPSTGPELFPGEGENPGWLGGLDLVAGGTWLGVNEYGLLVAVTNRQKHANPANPPSRGLLCRKLLTGRETASVVDTALRELQGNRFAGCNLLIADRDSVYVIEAGDTLRATRLHAGLHLLANARLNAADDPRIERVRRLFARANPATPEAWFQTAQHICQLSGSGDEPPICLSGTDRGTVSSIVLGLGRPLSASRYWFAPGPPNLAAYSDHTPLLRQLFDVAADQNAPYEPGKDYNQIGETKNDPPIDIEPPADSPARRAVSDSLTYGAGELQVPEPAPNSPYRILLRGPWQAEPLSRGAHDGTEQNSCGNPGSSTAHLPAQGTVRLPASWQELFGSFRGRVRFRRKFHPPSNITAADRIAIVFDRVGGRGSVSLNGRPLGSIEPDAATARFDVTGLLHTNNELQVDLEFADSGPNAPAGGLFAPVALEIVAGN